MAMHEIIVFILFTLVSQNLSLHSSLRSEKIQYQIFYKKIISKQGFIKTSTTRVSSEYFVFSHFREIQASFLLVINVIFHHPSNFFQPFYFHHFSLSS